MSALGPVVTLPKLERVVMAHVRRWLPTYLRAVEREEGVRADGETPLEPGSLPLPRSWRPTDGRIDKWPEDQLPAVIFGSPGLADRGGQGTRRDSGIYSAWFVCSLSTVTAGKNFESTRWLAGMYAAALIALMVQHPPAGGWLKVEALDWVDLGPIDNLPFTRQRSMYGLTAVFEIEIGEVVSARDGLPEPADDPIPEPELPEVLETDLTLERS